MRESWLNPHSGTLKEGLMAEFADKPCADCGGTFSWECMDFDHVRGEKLGNVSTLAHNRSPAAKLRLDAEVAKCDFICANCHRTRTWRSDRPLPTHKRYRKGD
jgi:hypothetical protein